MQFVYNDFNLEMIKQYIRIYEKWFTVAKDTWVKILTDYKLLSYKSQIADAQFYQ